MEQPVKTKLEGEVFYPSPAIINEAYIKEY